MTGSDDNSGEADNVIRFPGTIVRDPQNPAAQIFEGRRSLMWVLFSDMVNGVTLDGTANYVGRRLRRPCVLFDQGHALGIHMLGKFERSNFELDPYRRKSEKRLLKNLEKSAVGASMMLNRFAVPDDQYWIASLVSLREGTDREPIVTEMRMRFPSRLALRAYASVPVDDAYLARVEQCLRTWHARCVSAGVYGQKFPAGELTLTRYQQPAAANQRAETGFHATFPYTSGVTWPWLDLYSLTRRSFEKGRRLAFRFEHV